MLIRDLLIWRGVMPKFTWTLANRYRNLEPSALQGLLAAAADPSIISLAGGLPASDLLPLDVMKRATERVYKKYGAMAFQYGNTEGVPELREAVASMFPPPGHAIAAENVLITTGSQQGLDILSRILCDPGDTLLAESPSYVGGVQAFRLNQVKLQPLPTDDHGVVVNTFADALAGPGVKGAYLIPNFQNPSGVQLHPDRREAIATALKGTSKFLIEDDPYGDLKFENVEMLSIISKAPEQTAYLGTFSKRLAPGLRVGWTIATPDLIERLAALKQGLDLHTSTFVQYVVLEALTDPVLFEQMEQVRYEYHKRCKVALEILEAELSDYAVWTRPAGGMFIWLTFKGNINTEEILPALIAEAGVAYVPGTAFYPDGRGVNQARLNFSANPPERLAEGIMRFAKFVKSRL